MSTILFFLSSGLFLGWSLGANDAANVFGTAVGSKMLRFRTAAIVCSIFIVIGAVFGGSGANHTLGKLGAIDTLPGAFTVALSAAISVFMMTRTSLPVSTSQAIVGGIIGWNLFSSNPTSLVIIRKIVLTWVICPVLSCLFSIIIFFIIKEILERTPINIYRRDSYTRAALLLAGAFGSFSLGANNIANVMGVFTTAAPFKDILLFNGYAFSSVQQLFLLGGIAISVGVFTYSKRVMETVGSRIFKLSPIAAFVVVLASSLVLFVFASSSLKSFLESINLPSLPLVPVSSSQAVVGAVIGIGLAKGGKNIRFGSLGKIGLGWIFTPVISAVLCYVLLFFMQNVFMTRVYG